MVIYSIMSDQQRKMLSHRNFCSPIGYPCCCVELLLDFWWSVIHTDMMVINYVFLCKSVATFCIQYVVLLEASVRFFKIGFAESYLPDFTTVRAAAFCTFCSFFTCFFDMPYRRPLLRYNLDVTNAWMIVSVALCVRYFLIAKILCRWYHAADTILFTYNYNQNGRQKCENTLNDMKN